MLLLLLLLLFMYALGSLSSLTVPTANDTAFCGSEHTLSHAPEKQGKRISWKVSAWVFSTECWRICHSPYTKDNNQ